MHKRQGYWEAITESVANNLKSVRYHRRHLTQPQNYFTSRNAQDDQQYHLRGLLESLEYVQDDLLRLRIAAAGRV